MHPMDINWFFDHDDLDDLRLRAIEKLKSSPFSHALEERWLKLDTVMFNRARICQDYKIEYYNISLRDETGSNFSLDHLLLNDRDFASENPNGIVESQELHYHCWPSNFDWVGMIDDSIEAILRCVVTVSADGSFDRKYLIDLIVSLDDIQKMGWDKFSSFMDSFN